LNEYERSILYMGAKDHAFAQHPALDPYQEALDWIRSVPWSDLSEAEAETMAGHVADRVFLVRERTKGHLRMPVE